GVSRPRGRGVRGDATGRGDVCARSGAPGARARAGTAGGCTGPRAARSGGTPRRVPAGAAGRCGGGDRSGSGMTNAIEIQRLCYRTGRTFEIKDLTLHVPPGAIYGFLGPDGCGKTTTIRLMLVLLRLHAGGITLLGEAVTLDVARVLARVGCGRE